MLTIFANAQVYRGGDIDRTTFEQILEMDEDPAEREFSKSIVFDFFQQASETFEKMDKYLYGALLYPLPHPYP